MVMDSSVVEEVQEVRKLLWGNQIKDDIFRRWSQGFVYSADEPSALVQNEGGPCAVIAPVQAFILKAVLSDKSIIEDNLWRKLPKEQVDSLLCQSLAEILYQAANSDELLAGPKVSSKLQLLLNQQVQNQPQTSGTSEPGGRPKSSANPYCIVFLNEPLSRRVSSESEADGVTPPPSIVERRVNRSEEEIFHRNLRILKLENINQVRNVLKEKVEALKSYYGVLQFLYSVLLTKGLQNLMSEVSDVTELIDPIHGHGSQSLINLMLTGRAVNYVWDDEKDVGGLKLKGIEGQSQVGFLTLLEKLRYCEVGSYLKNPKFPVWMLGSETHLTVLFSTNFELVAPESPAEMARRVFHSYDPEGNNFISSVLLEDVLRSLDLFADSEYVELMKKKLDPETLGIILLNDFMDEFYPNERLRGPDTFVIYHYNGLPRSSFTHTVKYQEGNAILLESDLRCLQDENTILTCLQTKWPNIEVNWLDGTPSIN